MSTPAIIAVDIDAGTQKFIVNMSAAKASVREFSSEGVSSHKALATAVKGVEGNLLGNARAAEAFLESIKGIGPLVQTMFPVLGAVAFAGIIGELGKKVYEFFKNAEEGQKKMDQAFKGFALGSKTSLDEIHLSNDKLQQDIDKLQGKKTNNLALALDEARVMMDRLAESSDTAYAKLKKVLEETNPSWYHVRTPGNKDVQKDAEEFQGKLSGVHNKYNEQLDAVKPGSDAYKKIKANAAAEIDKLYADELKEQTGKRDITQLNANASPGTNYKPLLGAQNTNIDYLRSSRDTEASTYKNDDLSVKKNGLEQQKEQDEKAKEAAKKQEQALKDSYDRMLAEIEASEPMMASEKLAFRQEELKEIEQYGKANVQLRQELALQIAQLTQEDFAAGKAAYEKHLAEQKAFMMKAYEDMLVWQREAGQGKTGLSKTLLDFTHDENGNPSEDKTKLKPQDRTDTTVGTEAMLSQAGYKSASQQQSSIDTDQDHLKTMQALNYPLQEQLELREKILQAQIALAQSQNLSSNSQQTDLANLNAKQTIQGWGNSGLGGMYASGMQSMLQVPGQLGGALAGGLMGGKKGEDVGKQVADAMKGIGKQMMGDIFTKLIEQIVAQITSMLGLTVAVTANTAAQTASAVSGAGGAMGGVMGMLKPLLGLLGFADGTDYAPGGKAWVGEHGPEILNIPRGAQVIPNHKTQSYLDGMSTSSSTYNSGGHTFHINGAVSPLETARQVSKVLKDSSPTFSPYAH